MIENREKNPKVSKNSVFKEFLHSPDPGVDQSTFFTKMFRI